jgi:hypothetical protein
MSYRAQFFLRAAKSTAASTAMKEAQAVFFTAQKALERAKADFNHACDYLSEAALKEIITTALTEIPATVPKKIHETNDIALENILQSLCIDITKDGETNHRILFLKPRPKSPAAFRNEQTHKLLVMLDGLKDRGWIVGGRKVKLLVDGINCNTQKKKQLSFDLRD